MRFNCDAPEFVPLSHLLGSTLVNIFDKPFGDIIRPFERLNIDEHYRPRSPLSFSQEESEPSNPSLQIFDSFETAPDTDFDYLGRTLKKHQGSIGSNEGPEFLKHLEQSPSSFSNAGSESSNSEFSSSLNLSKSFSPLEMPGIIRVDKNLINLKDRKLRHKTDLCRNYMTSKTCQYGENCSFAHGVEELKAKYVSLEYKTKPCREYQKGLCSYGYKCTFRHD